MSHKVRVVHGEEDFFDRLDRTRREGYGNLLTIVLRWVLTIIAFAILFYIIVDYEKMFLFAFVVFGGLAAYSWYVEINNILKRREKFGRRWKWWKDPLLLEFIGLIVIVLLIWYGVS